MTGFYVKWNNGLKLVNQDIFIIIYILYLYLFSYKFVLSRISKDFILWLSDVLPGNFIKDQVSNLTRQP